MIGFGCDLISIKNSDIGIKPLQKAYNFHGWPRFLRSSVFSDFTTIKAGINHIVSYKIKQQHVQPEQW